MVEYNGVDGGGGAGGQSVKKFSKSRQKVEESSKNPKALKVWKICKGHWFKGTFTEALIFRQGLELLLEL